MKIDKCFEILGMSHAQHPSTAGHCFFSKYLPNDYWNCEKTQLSVKTLDTVLKVTFNMGDASCSDMSNYAIGRKFRIIKKMRQPLY